MFFEKKVAMCCGAEIGWQAVDRFSRTLIVFQTCPQYHHTNTVFINAYKI